MTIIYTQLPSPVGMDGTPVELAWQAQDSDTGVTTMLNFPLGTTQATAEAALLAVFQINQPIPLANDSLPIFVNKATGAAFILDANGKPMIQLKRGADGGVDIIGMDSNGNGVSYTKSQVISLQFRGTKVALATWPISFTRIPSVSLTLGDASSQPPYKIAATKTGVTVKFNNAYTGSVEIHGAER